MEYSKYIVENEISINWLVSVFEEKYSPKHSFAGESHNYWEGVYVKSGKVGITADDRVLYLTEGQIIFHKPMEFHRLWSAGGTSPDVIIFSFSATGKSMRIFQGLVTELTKERRALLQWAVAESQKVFRGFLSDETGFWYVEREHPPFGAAQIMKNYLEVLLLEIARDEGREADVLYSSSNSARLYREAVRFLEENIEGSLCVEDICTHLNCSRSNLKKVFNRFVGTGVMKHYLKLKINRSVELMGQGYNIGEISDMLSFSSPYYFSTAFRREMGVPPSKYK